MQVVYLVRHGETDWNLERRIQGHTDIPLNETGRAQARDASAYFSRVRLDAVISSDLSRAAETAEILSGKKPQQVPGLREKYMAEAEGEVGEEFKERTGLWPFAFGETPDELGLRMEKAYWAVLDEHASAANILIVAHGACLKALLRRLVQSGRVQGEGELAQAANLGTKKFVNLAMSKIVANKLVEYGHGLTGASAVAGNAI